MTALDHYQPAGGAVASWGQQAQTLPVANRSVVNLVEFAEAAKAAHEVAIVLVRTPFVPEAYRDNPYAATAAMLAGDEVGLSPMASMNAFDVIQGRAAPKAMTLRAIVQSRGHEIWVEESTDSRCVMRGRRAGSSIVQESDWTIQRARTMNLTSKSQWKLQPQAMLVARATSECCRLVAADAILGIPYSAEEIADEVAAVIAQATSEAPAGPARTAQRRASKRSAATPQAERHALAEAPAARAGGTEAAAPSSPLGPPLPGEDGYDEPAPDDAPPPDPTNTQSSVEQNKMMHALFREADVTDRDERLKLTGLLLGRQLDTSKGLTVADASAIIDALVTLQNAGHEGGLAGAVNDLLNEQALVEAEQEAADDAAAAEA